MRIDISADLEARLTAIARAEGISLNGLLARMIDERERLAATVEQCEDQLPALSPEEIHKKIERGFLQSERGEIVDGETFTTNLLDEMNAGGKSSESVRSNCPSPRRP